MGRLFNFMRGQWEVLVRTLFLRWRREHTGLTGTCQVFNGEIKKLQSGCMFNRLQTVFDTPD